MLVTHATTEESSWPRPATPSRRRHRRQPHPVRPRRTAAYAKASNQDMLTAALEGLVARFGLAGERVGEVAAGAVLKHSRDFNLTREAVLGSSLSPRTPAYDVQQACGTGLEAAILVANKIALGQIESGIAGGVDTASDAPDRRQRGPARRRCSSSTAPRRPASGLKALTGLRPGQLVPEIPRNVEPRTGLSMGEHMASTAAQWGITREAQDELAAASHQQPRRRLRARLLRRPGDAYLGLTRDQNLRADSTRREARQAQAGLRQGRRTRR